MRSRIDIKVRLAAHILAVAIFVFIWTSVVPQQTFDSSRFAEGETTPVSAAGDKREWNQPAPTVDALPLPDETVAVQPPVPVEEQTPEQQPVVEAPPLPDETVAVQPPEAMEEQTPEPVGDVPEMLPAETPEDTPVVTESEDQPGSEPEAPPESEPEPVAVPVTEEPVAEPAVPLEEAAPVVPSEEEAAPALPTLSPEEFFIEESDTVIPVEPALDAEPESIVEPESLTLQPDESGALAVADTQLPEAASLPLPEIDGLEFYRDGLYWLVAANANDERLALLPNETPLLYLYGGKESLPDAALLETQSFLANADTLTEDSAEQFLRVVDSLRLRPAGLAAAVVLTDSNTSAYYKGVYLLVVQGLDFDAMLAATERELQLSGGLRDEIIHRLRRLDLTPLKRFVP